MCRFDGESISFMTYMPGGSTLLGTWIVSLTVRMVFLFHSSARALGASAAPTSSPTDAMVRTMRFMCLTPLRFFSSSSLLAPALRTSVVATMDCKYSCESYPERAALLPRQEVINLQSVGTDQGPEPCKFYAGVGPGQ